MKTIRNTTQRVTTLFIIVIALFCNTASAAPPSKEGYTPVDSVMKHRQEPRWVSPVPEPVEVLRAFQKPQHRWSKGHRGVDMAADGAIRAPRSGKIIFSGKVVDRYVITIEHDDGYKSSFEPVTNAKEAGQEVSLGEIIAQVDNTIHHCTKQCIHWGVRQKIAEEWEYINPLALLHAEKPSVLLPVEDDFLA
ncbi:M23 family metallopeptidase [Rothia sp. CCM 9418]|uniref:M23 family metallopeptidase n=1 Tax=Rothia sp. CCM 9418 TaxID=3402661 RepID=UPI003AE16038